MIKECNVCGFIIDRSLAHHIFYRDGKTQDGFGYTCKACKRDGEDAARRRRRDARRYEKDRTKVLARQKARDVLGKAGGFPCAVLGCDAAADEFHHVDYKAPLDVVPLCKKHHTATHN